MGAKLGARESQCGPFKHRGNKIPKLEICTRDRVRMGAAERVHWGLPQRVSRSIRFQRFIGQRGV